MTSSARRGAADRAGRGRDPARRHGRPVPGLLAVLRAIRLARRLEPRLPIGFIAGAALGDVARLDVDFLMVRADLATRRLVERAALRGTAVHARTVNDPAWLARLLDRGVADA